MSKWTSRKINISKKYTEDEREAIAFEIVSYIQKRTKQGKGKDNKKWTPPADKYSKEYRQSLDFKNVKGGATTVNLSLSGDMLDAVDLLDDRKGELTIGISDADEDNAKAEGNIRGSYGKSTGSKSKARDFLAISKTEVDKILRKFPLKDDDERESNVLAFLEAAKAARELIKDKSKVVTLGSISLGQ